MNGKASRWILQEIDPLSEKLAQNLGLPLPLGQILVNRGITSPEEAELFLRGSLADLPSPHLFSDMNRCLDRVEQAIERKEKILVFGDYDADGILAVVMLHRALSSLGAEIDYYIPDRLKEGYGIKQNHLPLVQEKGAKVVISVDCGIKANNFVRKAREAGIDVIITDHHQPGEEIPPAYAVLNPHLPGSGYPDRNLAGVGVVFKLIQALLEKRGKAYLLPHYTKLVAIGTISDVAPLAGENRILVRHGLKTLAEARNQGLRSLLSTCGLQGQRISEWDVGYRIGPRINAAGRMASAEMAVRLFLTDSPEEACSLAEHLDRFNSQRQQAEEKILGQARSRIEQASLHEKYPLLILGCEEWHRGIIGIVAARLKEYFHRPVILFSYENNQAFGSGRSISAFSLIRALQECQALFQEFGGHPHAAGCVLPRERMAELKDSLNYIARTTLRKEDLKRTLRIDSPLHFRDLSRSFLEVYALLPPFGTGNPRPLFLFPGVTVVSAPQIVQGRHAKLRLEQDGRIFDSMIWEGADLAASLGRGARLDVVASLQSSTFWGEETLILSIEDWKEAR